MFSNNKLNISHEHTSTKTRGMLCPYPTETLDKHSRPNSDRLPRTPHSLLPLLTGNIQQHAHAEDAYYVVTNAGRRDRDLTWLKEKMDEWNTEGKGKDGKSRWSFWRGGGYRPRSSRLSTTTHSFDLQALPFGKSAFVPIEGYNLHVARGGYTGEDGFEISIPPAQATSVASLLSQSPVQLIGLGARDSLRLEAGMCLYGQDLDESTSPVEAGLSWVIGESLFPIKLCVGNAWLEDEEIALVWGRSGASGSTELSEIREFVDSEAHLPSTSEALIGPRSSHPGLSFHYKLHFIGYSNMRSVKAAVSAACKGRRDPSTATYIGASTVLKHLKEGPPRRRIGLIVEGAPARQGAKILTPGSECQEIGAVTSGIPSPTLGKNIAMGYVRNGHHKKGTELEVEVRGKKRKAVVTPMPFIKPGYYRG
ncbi:Aminomethyltransferase folate-binding domain-containing protein [Cyathus striatus]|nr:Aminomethyltransferase folate-binding domain-containing protein [Cyathus striatus]